MVRFLFSPHDRGFDRFFHRFLCRLLLFCEDIPKIPFPSGNMSQIEKIVWFQDLEPTPYRYSLWTDRWVRSFWLSRQVGNGYSVTPSFTIIFTTFDDHTDITPVTRMETAFICTCDQSSFICLEKCWNTITLDSIFIWFTVTPAFEYVRFLVKAAPSGSFFSKSERLKKLTTFLYLFWC